VGCGGGRECGGAGDGAGAGGQRGAGTLISDAIGYAAAGSATGLYVSLNCEYSSAAAGTAVPLLASVQGGGFTVQGESSSCSSVPGTVNAWQAGNIAAFNGLTGSALSLSQWASPACAVQETFDAWPPAYVPLAIQVSGGGAASPAEVTVSSGLSGQPYVLAGSAAAAVAVAAPAEGGVPASGAMTGGAGNAASAGLSASIASAGDPVNPENGDFSVSATDVSVATFGPALGFSRTYDAALAEQQARTATPGPLGYGWTDNWASSLSTASPVPGDMYTLDGMRLDTGKGGPALKAALNDPGAVYANSSGVYIAETTASEVSEIPAATGTQWGIAMTAGDLYTIAGSQYGTPGDSPNGTAAASALLDDPQGLAFDSSGNLYIADSGNNRVLEVPAATGGGKTADDIYTIAGNWGGSSGHSGDGGAATSAFLLNPVGLGFDPSGDLYIADSGNNRVQEVFATGGQQWGQTGMTAGDIYTAAGSPSGTSGDSLNGTAAKTSLLDGPEGVNFSSGGDMYIADTGNNRIVEAAKSGGTQWTITMTADDLYTVAGSATGSSGRSASGTLATAALLDSPVSVYPDNGTQLYVNDTGNSRIEEVARTGHTEWGITMTVNKMYTIAGIGGSAGFSGDGGAATSATVDDPLSVAMDGSFNMYIADYLNHRVREVTASTGDIATYAGDGATIPQEGDAGPAATAALYQPLDEAFDGYGDVFIQQPGPGDRGRRSHPVRDRHDRRRRVHGGGQRQRALRGLRQRRRGGPGVPEQPRSRRGRRQREPVHRRHRQQPDPGSRRVHRRRVHDRGQRDRNIRAHRERRRGDIGAAEHPGVTRRRRRR
jgi:hypothetical protein